MRKRKKFPITIITKKERDEIWDELHKEMTKWSLQEINPLLIVSQIDDLVGWIMMTLYGKEVFEES